MIRLLYSRRHRRHEETLDRIDTLEFELGMKPTRERSPSRRAGMRTAAEAAEAWSASASRSAANYTAGVSSLSGWEQGVRQAAGRAAHRAPMI